MSEKRDLPDSGILAVEWVDKYNWEDYYLCCRCHEVRDIEDRFCLMKDMDDVSKHYCQECDND